jgi:hypothetical protein
MAAHRLLSPERWYIFWKVTDAQALAITVLRECEYRELQSE